MSNVRYLDVGEIIAVEHIAKAVNAFTLTTPSDLSERSAKNLRDLSRAIRLWGEVREWGEAVSVTKALREALVPIEDSEPVLRVIDRSMKVLTRRAGTD